MRKSIVTTTVAFRSVLDDKNMWYIAIGNALAYVNITNGIVGYVIDYPDYITTMAKGGYIIEDVAFKWSGDFKEPSEVVFIVGTKSEIYKEEDWDLGPIPEKRECEVCMRALLCSHMGECVYK